MSEPNLEERLYALVRRAVHDELIALGFRAMELRAGGLPVVEHEPDLVALGEVRRWVRVSKTTLKEWIRSGALPSYGKGRIVRVRLAEVRAVLVQRSSAPAVQPAGRAGEILASLEKKKR